jgi:hypothetical protein
VRDKQEKKNANRMNVLIILCCVILVFTAGNKETANMQQQQQQVCRPGSATKGEHCRTFFV